MSNPEAQPAAEGSGGISPLDLGARLKAAREARGLERKDVAQRLRLDEHVIEALEAGDPARLPARTFVRGYLRNYARLVGLDEALVAEATPAAALKRRRDYRGPVAGPALGRWIGYLFLLVLLAALVLFAYPALNRLWEGWQEPATGTAEEGLRLPAPLPGEAGRDGGALEPIWPLPEGDAPADAPAEPPAQDAPALERPEPAVPPVPSEPEPVPEPEPEPVPEPAASVPAARLVLTFREESWVEIHDRDGRLLYGLMAPGRREQLSGTPPFRLLLGNAAGVELEYDGRRIDTSAHTRGSVARLRLE